MMSLILTKAAHKYSKNINMVKYYNDLKELVSISLYFKM